MAIRFRKSKKLMPGVRLNVGKKSVGVRIGGKNAGFSIGTAGKSIGASLPGTGLGITSQSRKGCLGSFAFLAAAALTGALMLGLPQGSGAQAAAASANSSSVTSPAR